MNQFPHEFEALLSRTGRKVLAGKHPAAGALQRGGFIAAPGLLEPKRLAGCTRLIARTFEPLLVEFVGALPPPDSAKTSHGDSLPKVGRMLTVPRGGFEAKVAQGLAREIGLLQMLRSESFRRFSEVLAGRRLAALATAQVLCNRRGDYAGPHADHHPDEPGARDGYVDVHLTFTTPGVREQFIVYARDGHLLVDQGPFLISGLAEDQMGAVTLHAERIW